MLQMQRVLTTCLFGVLTGFPVQADIYTYSYVGNPFTRFDDVSTCPPTCRITGSITSAQPLPANTPIGAHSGYGVEVFPDSFAFTDGNITITNSTPGFAPGLGLPSGAAFLVGTRDGLITTWEVNLQLSPEPTYPAGFAILVTQNNNNRNSGFVVGE